jgi:DNA modification methylase
MMQLHAASIYRIHGTVSPRGLPEFFIRLCTEEGDTVLDPFAGSNVTGEAAELLKRCWIATELCEEYLVGSRFRFENIPSSNG